MDRSIRAAANAEMAAKGAAHAKATLPPMLNAAIKPAEKIWRTGTSVVASSEHGSIRAMSGKQGDTARRISHIGWKRLALRIR
jgi:hypothetical protein